MFLWSWSLRGSPDLPAATISPLRQNIQETLKIKVNPDICPLFIFQFIFNFDGPLKHAGCS